MIFGLLEIEHAAHLIALVEFPQDVAGGSNLEKVCGNAAAGVVPVASPGKRFSTR